MKPKKIPYGLTDYKRIKEEGYYVVDKTKFIEELEHTNENFLVFLRPRRFGKSLFLSTLQYYYDENSKDEFDAIFSDTYIGKNPTPLKSSYRILFFEFSGINTDESMQRIYEQFLFKIKMSLSRYFDNYGYKIGYRELKDINNPTSLMEYFFEAVKNDQIYLLIDEYDQFANAILAHSMQEFLKIVSKGGFVRSFYEVIKGATLSGVVQKMFITGVTPITLDSLSSGFNIVSNISMDEDFNAMAGFTQNEVDYSLRESIFKRCNIEGDELLAKVKTWYNGYNFLGTKVYNPFDILKFIKNDYSFENYWWESGNPFSLIELLKNGNYFLPSLQNIKIDKKLLSRLTILYVEDDDNIRNELSNLLSNFLK